jgi:hypothetical protein
MRFYSDDLRKEARTIAAGGKGARQAWTDLRQWASKRGPAASKCAMMEFLSAYGGTPEAAFVMPEIMRSASTVFSPEERTELVGLASKKPSFNDSKPLMPPIGPKPSMPIASARPSLALSFKPSVRENMAPRLGAIEPIVPSADHAYLRDMPIRMRDRIEASSLRAPMAGLPKESANMGGRDDTRSFQFDPHKSPDSAYLGANKGEHIVRSLIHSMRSHGRDEIPHMAPAPIAAKPKARKKTIAKRAAKPAARKAKHARKPATRKTSARKGAARKPARKPGKKHGRR